MSLLTHVGEWKGDKQHGKGKVVMPDGDVFEGEFEDGSRVSGVLATADGALYTGSLVS